MADSVGVILSATHFHRALPRLAPQVAAPSAERRFLPAVEFDQSYVNFPAASESPSNEFLAQQAWETARQLASSMSPTSFVNLALIAAMKVTDEATENRDAEVLLESLTDQRSLEESQLLMGLYQKLEPHLMRSLPMPLLSGDSRVGEGLQAGQQILLNPEKLTEPNLALFVMGHEAAHAEGRHTVRSAGLRETGGLLLAQEGGKVAVRQAEWDLEREADTRAVELSVKAGLQDPRPVLKVLLESAGGEEHPEGYERAVAVREAFHRRGVEVVEDDWQILLKETQATRDAHRRAKEKEELFRRSLSRYV